MGRIRQLSQSLINKIAAGEVIERPASVVKELMENAVDAGATRIDVAVETGGVDLVRVADNGSGIAPDDLPLAVASHATSKLAEADDLFCVRTLGFRGEALASIGEVSRLLVRSRTPDSPSGYQIEVNGGRVFEVAPCGCPVGTSIEVRQLFFNTPVRRKFLRSTQTELGHVSEAFTRVALADPTLHCTLRHNDRAMFELSASDGWIERIGRFFGRELAEALIWVESTQGPIRLAGYAAHPGQTRSHNRMQYLFLNRRAIRDRSLQHALAEAYRGLIMTGRYPIAFLSLELPPDEVDVNVHPTKLEVRFQDSGRLYSQVLSTLRSKFLATDLNTRVPSATPDPSETGIDPLQAVAMRQQVVDWAKGKVSGWGEQETPPILTPAARSSYGDSSSPRAPLELTRLDRSWAPAGRPTEPDDPFGPIPENPATAPTVAEVSTPVEAAPPEPLGGQPLHALQVHNRYLVAESDEGMLVIDQHALHERILYEHLRQRVAQGSIEAQQLLVPEPVDLTPAESAAALEQRDVLARLGLKIEPFGGDTILVASYPAMLANINPGEILRGLVECLLAGGKTPDHRDLFDELLHTVACKAAIKAGDRLSPAEITSLLEQRHLIEDAHHCPHGRPTALVFTREQLDKHFKRV